MSYLVSLHFILASSFKSISITENKILSLRVLDKLPSNIPRSYFVDGFSKKCELNIYKVEVSWSKKIIIIIKLKWVYSQFKKWDWVFLPQSLDCPVSPLEFGLRSLLPSSKFCVFLLKIFNVLGFPCSFINNIT